MRCAGRWVSIGFILLLLPSPGSAQGQGDGQYGRLDNDFTLELGVGGGISWADGRRSATSAYDVRWLVIDAGGLVCSGTWGPDAGGFLFLGVEVRPLWPMLYFLGADLARERWDLLIQSIGIELGTVIGPLGDQAGIGFGAGFAMSIPLVLPSQFAQGVFLRLAARHQIFDEDHQRGGEISVRSWIFYGTIAVRIPVDFGLGGWSSPRYRPR